MKNKKMRVILAVALVLTALFSITSFAQPENQEYTSHKVTLSYDKSTGKVNANIYISSGTAIVGYCSFSYDNTVLNLTDMNGKTVPHTNVPDFNEKGDIYLTDIITSHNGIVITDIGKKTSNLINPNEGYFMFAWFLPESMSHIDATSGDVLIASLSFRPVSGVTAEDFNNDTLRVADKTVTDKVGGWYPGIVVMNASQQQFNFDGSVDDSDLFVFQYNVDGIEEFSPDETYELPESSQQPPADNDEKPEQVPSDSTDSPALDETPQNPPEESDNQETNEPDNEQSEKDSENKPSQESENEDSNEHKNETGKNQQDNDDDESKVLLDSTTSFKADFNLKFSTGESSLHISWKAPVLPCPTDNYTAVLCDSNFNIIRQVDIFNSSTSYTFKNIKDGFDYKFYFYATSSAKTYCSDVYNITLKQNKKPEPIIYSVSYDAGKGYLYGLDSEKVIFGHCLTKIPSVTAPDGMYFVGWSKDKKNVFDTSSPVYSNLKLYALYSDKPSSLSVPSYITGYVDKTFKPFGSISRAEAAVLISRIVPEYNPDGDYSHSFSDCESGAWYEKAVAFCSSKGYITGYLNGTFNPSGKITRAEFATIIVRVFGFENVKEINIFTDMSGHWACPYVSRLFGAGIITCGDDGKFNPGEFITRKDAVLLINACIGLEPDKDAIDNYLIRNGYKFSDIEQYQDYFYPIMAATLKAEEYNN